MLLSFHVRFLPAGDHCALRTVFKLISVQWRTGSPLPLERIRWRDEQGTAQPWKEWGPESLLGAETLDGRFP